MDVRVRVALGKKVGAATVNGLHEGALERVVEQALAAARLQRENPDFPGFPGPAPLPETPPGAGFVAATAEATAEARADRVGTVCRRATGAGLVAAGACSTAVREEVVANSAGTYAYQAGTAARLLTVVAGDTSSGYSRPPGAGLRRPRRRGSGRGGGGQGGTGARPPGPGARGVRRGAGAVRRGRPAELRGLPRPAGAGPAGADELRHREAGAAPAERGHHPAGRPARPRGGRRPLRRRGRPQGPPDPGGGGGGAGRHLRHPDRGPGGDAVHGARPAGGQLLRAGGHPPPPRPRGPLPGGADRQDRPRAARSPASGTPARCTPSR